MKLKVTLNVCASKHNISIEKLLSQKLKININDIIYVNILKKSIDARKKDSVRILYTLEMTTTDHVDQKILNYKEVSEITNERIFQMDYNEAYLDHSPIIVGFGPSGIFAALYLAKCNLKPIIIERGSSIENRDKDINNFIENNILNENSNIQFGEGGAGAYSDGKLTTNLKDPLNKYILEQLVEFGAPKEIMYDSMPHIGTDIIKEVVKKIRAKIIDLGGTFHFNTTFSKYEKSDNLLKVYAKNNNEELVFTTNHLLLGLGHSAYDTIKYLSSVGLNMEAKPFSMGVRIENLQKDINKMQYGNFSEHLPPATYKTVIHLENRSMYSFCMCPGGYVMASSNLDNHILTNGMSNYKRDNVNANSALLVNVDVKDYYKDNVLDGFLFQHKYERLAFDISKDYKAPANLVKEFLNNEVAKSVRSVKPTYNHGVVLTDLSKCLPDFVYESLKSGLKLLKKRMPQLVSDDTIITGVETRSSSPVRILRDEQRQSNIRGIYPMGEGAGYAGGIMSAALDGLKTAMSITSKKE